jgi:hypothetical protein
VRKENSRGGPLCQIALLFYEKEKEPGVRD